MVAPAEVPVQAVDDAHCKGAGTQTTSTSSQEETHHSFRRVVGGELIDEAPGPAREAVILPAHGLARRNLGGGLRRGHALREDSDAERVARTIVGSRWRS